MRTLTKLSLEDIQEVQQELGVVLPTLYKTLLIELGYGRLDQWREIYHPSQIHSLYDEVFDDPEWLFNIYFPFGCNDQKQEIWIIDVRQEKAASIWHEYHPESWEEEKWLPYDEWAITYLSEYRSG